MGLLIAGVLVWSLVHLSKSLTPAWRTRLIARIGEGPYKGLFSVLILIGLALIVIGWRSAAPVPVYLPPDWGRAAGALLMIAAVVLFVAARPATNLKRWIRHPQLTSIMLWAIAHLLANGDRRSLVLFGGLGIWAFVEIIAINRRDGPRARPQAVALKADIAVLAIAALAYLVLLWAHPYLAGVRVVGAANIISGVVPPLR